MSKAPYKFSGNKPYKKRGKGVPRKAYVSRTRKTRSANNAARATIMSYPMPQKVSTQLVVSFNAGVFSTLTSSDSDVYRPTSYFDIDPAVGGPSFSGYTFFASMYQRYRVTGFAYTITFTNLETTSVMVSVQGIPSVATPASGTAFDATEMAEENEFSTTTILAPTSATPTRTLKGYINCKKLWGTPEALTDNDWAGAVGASPAANCFLRVGAHMLNNTNMTVGVQYHVKIKSYGYWDQKLSDVIG